MVWQYMHAPEPLTLCEEPRDYFFVRRRTRRVDRLFLDAPRARGYGA